MADIAKLAPVDFYHHNQRESLMTITSRLLPDSTISILELKGRFDAYEEIAMREQLNKAIADSNGRVVIKLREVEFIDSTALAILVIARKSCREQTGDLYLCEPQPNIRFVFELTRLNRAFHIFATEHEAIATFVNREYTLSQPAPMYKMVPL